LSGHVTARRQYDKPALGPLGKKHIRGEGRQRSHDETSARDRYQAFVADLMKQVSDAQRGAASE
jgi:hypothetical protein